ncbi:MAG: serine hydrolase domain-containing protein, partial [Pseudomonadota bacterium]
MRGLLFLICFALGVFALAIGTKLPVIANSAVALAARQACTLTFVSGMPLDEARKTYIDDHIAPASSVVGISVDVANKAVSANLLGIVRRRASLTEGYGCILEYSEAHETLEAFKRPAPSLLRADEATHRMAFNENDLTEALEKAFREPLEESVRNTMAIVVLKDGALVAEKYREGITPQTPLPGFSMAKSMTATLVGLLVEHKGLDVYTVIPVADILTEAEVTYDQLLRMTSGIGVNEDGSGKDKNS